MPDSLCPGTVHHASVVSVNGPTVMVSLSPGFSILVPSVPGRRSTSVCSARGPVSDSDQVIELPELTLIPGMMDMEVDLVLGGPGAGLNDTITVDPVKMTLRATVNAKRTLLAGFTTVRNLGLFVKTGGYMLDVALAEAIEAGWVDGPRIIPAGHAICPTGGHLDPSAQANVAPYMMPMSVEEGIASRVAEGGGSLDVVNLLRELEGEMREASGALEYERAALLRDQIRELKASAGLPAAEPAGAEKFGKAKPVNYRGTKKRVAKAGAPK